MNVYWLKRDFRLSDNPALHYCLKQKESCCVLFILEPSFISAPETSGFHIQSIYTAIEHLSSQGLQVLVLRQEVIEAFELLNKSLPINNLVSHEEVGNLRTFSRDKKVKQWCKENNTHWTEIKQTAVFRRLTNRDERQGYWKEFMYADCLEKPKPDTLSLFIIPEAWQPYQQTLEQVFAGTFTHCTSIQKVTEQAANTVLNSFLFDRGKYYSGNISSPNTALKYGSRLSPHLAWGTMTSREIYQKTQIAKLQYKEMEIADKGKWGRSLNSFTSRLHWRDHFMQRLESAPDMELHPINIAYDALPYTNTANNIEAFTKGETGFPMIDACMRCLNITGFINFRMRSMLTSFACFYLHIDWRVVHYILAKVFTDFEPGIHLSQLQMQAGVVGINTVRVYNPTKQIIDQDKECAFIKKWVPELANTTAVEIIMHEEISVLNYIKPIANKAHLKQMKDALWAIRKTQESKELSRQVYLKHGSRKTPLRKRKL